MLDACMIHMMPYLHNLFGTIVKAKEGKGKREREREREREKKRDGRSDSVANILDKRAR
jgi:hypothetical protein